MRECVSFDFFAPFDYVDVGFTEVWTWSQNFMWLGYPTVNFLIEMGSITVFCALQLLLIFIALSIH